MPPAVTLACFTVSPSAARANGERSRRVTGQDRTQLILSGIARYTDRDSHRALRGAYGFRMVSEQ